MKYIKTFENYVNSKPNINSILNSYLNCALWTEEERIEEENDMYNDDMYGEDEDEDNIKDYLPEIDFNIENIAPDAKIKAYEDIKKFLELAGNAIDGIIEDDLGYDIWLS